MTKGDRWGGGTVDAWKYKVGTVKYCSNQFLSFVLSLYNSQSSSLIRMKAMLGSPFLVFQLFEISEPKLISAMKSSSNSSTLSSTMVKFTNADLLAGVKTKSLIVSTTSVRPDSAFERCK